MTDRELLELAAKAAGYDVSVAKGGGSWINDGSRIWPQWNPLTDDGDAFRLAGVLGFSVDFGSGIIVCNDDVGGEFDNPSEISNVRMAIVRGAAEIGRSMP